MGFSMRVGVVLMALAATGCAGGKNVGNASSGPATGQRFTSFPGNPWSVSCLTFPGMPEDQRQSCRAELQLGTPASAIQAGMFTVTGGARWLLRTQAPVTGFAVQVDGHPVIYFGRCLTPGMPCSIDQNAGPQMTQELLAGRFLVVTVFGPWGNMTQRSPTAGLAEALRSAVSQTSPGVLRPENMPPPGSVMPPAVPAPAPAAPAARPTGRPLNF